MEVQLYKKFLTLDSKLIWIKWTQGRSQYEANRGTRLGKILPNTVIFFLSDW